MRAAVTGDTGGRLLITGLDCLGVITAVIGRLLVGVTGGAGNLRGSGFMRRGFYVGMAIDTAEHPAVNRILEFLLIHVEADLLAIYIGGHGRITVAGQAFFIGRLRGSGFVRGAGTAGRQ